MVGDMASTCIGNGFQGVMDDVVGSMDDMAVIMDDMAGDDVVGIPDDVAGIVYTYPAPPCPGK